jgi:D-galactarolactone isomerase
MSETARHAPGQHATAVPGSCDTHLHFYDSASPVSPTALLHPDDAMPHDYREVQRQLGLDRLVIVQPTTYGLDNSCQLDAMVSFGDSARGVMVVDTSTSVAELRRLTGLGVRGARFHMLPGGAVPWSMLDGVAARIAPFGWHIQLQLNGRELADRREQLLRLPVDVVIDHVGRFMPPVDADEPNFSALVDIVRSGCGWVKLSAPYESSTEPVTDSGDDHGDLDPLIDALVEAAPERLLWATNWPHPGQRKHPSPRTLATQLERWIPDAQTRRKILVDNPNQLYFDNEPIRRSS